MHSRVVWQLFCGTCGFDGAVLHDIRKKAHTRTDPRDLGTPCTIACGTGTANHHILRLRLCPLYLPECRKMVVSNAPARVMRFVSLHGFARTDNGQLVGLRVVDGRDADARCGHRRGCWVECCGRHQD